MTMLAGERCFGEKARILTREESRLLANLLDNFRQLINEEE